MFASNYIGRPKTLEDMCLHEFVQKYEMKYFGNSGKKTERKKVIKRCLSQKNTQCVK